jgi:hypothetical protein
MVHHQFAGRNPISSSQADAWNPSVASFLGVAAADAERIAPHRPMGTFGMAIA